MAEWYDVNANEVEANEVEANEVEANAIEANANEVEANANAVEANDIEANNINNANAVQNKYRCDCGCNLEFIDYEPGFDIYLGDSWLITANAMVDYKWSDYIWLHEFKLWQELREDIILNYNQVLNNEPINAADGPWVHLYNREVVEGHHMPLNGKLYYEYAY